MLTDEEFKDICRKLIYLPTVPNLTKWKASPDNQTCVFESCVSLNAVVEILEQFREEPINESL